MSAAEVLAVRYLMLPLGILWGAVIGGALELGGLVMLALGLAAALILRMLPVDSLKRQADRRRRSFMKQLPGALDMLLIAGAPEWICAMRFFIWRIITSPERFRRSCSGSAGIWRSGLRFRMP